MISKIEEFIEVEMNEKEDMKLRGETQLTIDLNPKTSNLAVRHPSLVNLLAIVSITLPALSA